MQVSLPDLPNELLLEIIKLVDVNKDPDILRNLRLVSVHIGRLLPIDVMLSPRSFTRFDERFGSAFDTSSRKIATSANVIMEDPDNKAKYMSKEESDAVPEKLRQILKVLGLNKMEVRDAWAARRCATVQELPINSVSYVIGEGDADPSEDWAWLEEYIQQLHSKHEGRLKSLTIGKAAGLNDLTSAPFKAKLPEIEKIILDGLNLSDIGQICQNVTTTDLTFSSLIFNGGTNHISRDDIEKSLFSPTLETQAIFSTITSLELDIYRGPKNPVKALRTAPRCILEHCAALTKFWFFLPCSENWIAAPEADELIDPIPLYSQARLTDIGIPRSYIKTAYGAQKQYPLQKLCALMRSIHERFPNVDRCTIMWHNQADDKEGDMIEVRNAATALGIDVAEKS
ncbi:hypothetical protein BDN72DRAFT_864514 [Pluteus cervinus]|uniref:Uncharacterized protein n=1 Tax=Pluteus cervinus TaxID=181527 RepID=A0ACD3A3F5_9AGAR|nr:hypothetical protein BDN72DRAFT_864514 [Pluteus cervinus]